MRVVVLRHHEEDDPGFVADALAARGARMTVHRHPDDGPLPDPAGADHVVVLGALWSVNDGGEVGAWVRDELEWLRTAAAAGAGVLGICFGAQLLAAAFGGSVERAPVPEIGWTEVTAVESAATLDDTVRQPTMPVPVDAVAPGPWLQFHGDRCVLPAGSTLLARTEVCPQAFTVGRCLGVQFHPEVDAAQLQRWLDGGSVDTVRAFGLDPEELVARTRTEEPEASRRAARLVDAYLGSLDV